NPASKWGSKVYCRLPGVFRANPPQPPVEDCWRRWHDFAEACPRRTTKPWWPCNGMWPGVMMSDPPRRLQMKFDMPSDPRYLPVVRGAISALAAAIGWDETECRAITLALDEALANVIRHAYHNRADGLIELECRESADGLEIT